MLVDLLHDLGVNLLSPFPNLSMEVLDIFGSLLGLPTKLDSSGNGSEIDLCAWIGPIDPLEWRETRSFAWCPIEGKLGMT